MSEIQVERSRICEHGQLRRSCCICEDQETIAAQARQIATLTAERDRAVEALKDLVWERGIYDSRLPETELGKRIRVILDAALAGQS